MVDATIEAAVKIAAVDISEIKKSLEQLRVSIDQGPILTELRTLRAVFEKPIKVTILTNIAQVQKDLVDALGKPITKEITAVPKGAGGEAVRDIPAPGVGEIGAAIKPLETIKGLVTAIKTGVTQVRAGFTEAGKAVSEQVKQTDLLSKAKNAELGTIDKLAAAQSDSLSVQQKQKAISDLLAKAQNNRLKGNIAEALASKEGAANIAKTLDNASALTEAENRILRTEKQIASTRNAENATLKKQESIVDSINAKRARGKVPTVTQLTEAQIAPTGLEQALFQVEKIRNLQNQLNQFKTLAAQTNKELGTLGRTGLVASGQIGGSFAQAIASAGGLTQSFGQTLVIATIRLAAFSVATKVIFGFQQVLRGAIQDIIKFETQLASANKIFRVSEETINAFGQSQVDLAVRFGQTIESVQAIGSEFARQGLTINQTLKATEGALLLVNAAGISTVEAMELLTIATNTYGQSFDDSTKIADLFVSVADSTASSVQDLVQGFSRAAATAEAAGVSQADLAATLGVVREATRRSATSLGTSFKSIIQFVSINRAEIEKLGVAVEAQNGTEREWRDILLDLGKVFATLTSEQKLAAAGAIVEKRRVNELIVAIEKAEKIQRISTDATRAHGLAQQKAGFEIETTASKLKALDAAFTGFVQELAQAGILDIFKGLISLTTQLFDGVRKVFGLFNKIPLLAPALTSTLGAFLVFGKIVPFVKNVVSKALEFFNHLRNSSLVTENIIISQSSLVKGLDQQLLKEKQILEEILLQNNKLADQLNLRQRISGTTPLGRKGDIASPMAGATGTTVLLSSTSTEKANAAIKDIGNNATKAVGPLGKMAGFFKNTFGATGSLLLVGNLLGNIGDQADKAAGKTTFFGNTLDSLGTGVQAGAIASLFPPLAPFALAIGAVAGTISLIKKEIGGIPSIEDKLKVSETVLQKTISQLEAIRDIEIGIGDGVATVTTERLKLVEALREAGSTNVELLADVLSGEADASQITKERTKLQQKLNEETRKHIQLLDEQLATPVPVSRFSDEGAFILQDIADIEEELAKEAFLKGPFVDVDQVRKATALFEQLRRLQESGRADPAALESIAQINRQINENLSERVKRQAASVSLTAKSLTSEEEVFELQQLQNQAVLKHTARAIDELSINKQITDEQFRQLTVANSLTDAEFAQSLAALAVSDGIKERLLARRTESRETAIQAVEEKKLAAEIIITERVLRDFNNTLDRIAKNEAIKNLDRQLASIKQKGNIAIIDLTQTKQAIDLSREVADAEERNLSIRKGQEATVDTLQTLIKKETGQIIEKEKILKNIVDLSRSEEQAAATLGITNGASKKLLEEISKLIKQGRDGIDQEVQGAKQLLNLISERASKEKETLKAAQDKFAADSLNRSIAIETAEIQEQIRRIRFTEANLGDKFGADAVALANTRLALEEQLIRKREESQLIELEVKEDKARREIAGITGEIKKLIDKPFTFTFGEEGISDIDQATLSLKAEIGSALRDAAGGTEIDLDKITSAINVAKGRLKAFKEDDVDLNLTKTIEQLEAFSAQANTAKIDLQDLREQAETKKILTQFEIDTKQAEEAQERLKARAVEFAQRIKTAFSAVEAAGIRGITVKLSLQELRRGGVQLAQDQITSAKEEARIREESARRQLEAAEQLRGRASPEFIEAERELIQTRLDGLDKVTEAQIAAAKTQIEAAKSAGESFLNLNREQRQSFIRNIAIAQSLFGGVQSAEEAARRAADIIRTPGGTDALRKALEGLKAIRGTGRQIGGVDVDIISEQIRLAADGGIKVEESLAEQQFALDEERNLLLKELVGKTLREDFASPRIVDAITSLSNDIKASIAAIQGGGAPEIIRRIADREITRTGADTAPIEAGREDAALQSARNILATERQLAEERSRIVNQIGTSFNEAVATRPTGAGAIGIDGAAIQSAADTFSNIVQERLNTVFATIAEQLNLNMGEGTAARLAQFGIKLDEFSNKLNSSLIDRTTEMQTVLGAPVNLKLDEQAQELKDKGISGNITLRSEINDVVVRIEATELVSNLTNAIQEFVSKEQLNAILTAIDRSLDGRLLTRGINIETGLG